MAQFPAPAEGILVTYFIVSRDVERSRRFYTDVLGGEAVLDGEPTIVALRMAGSPSAAPEDPRRTSRR